MKDNLVFWGADENNQKILTVLRLRAKEAKVDIWTFDRSKLDEAFVEKMFADWDEIDQMKFPDFSSFEERDVTENDLLPENIKADDTQLVIRAEAEWRVKILSIRLYEMLRDEIVALQEQVNESKEYDKSLWEMAKSYNQKVMSHNEERLINKDQFGKLRKILNDSFNTMKGLMEVGAQKFNEEAKANQVRCNEFLESIKERAEKGENPAGLFNHLKNFQKDFKTVRLSKSGRNDIWAKLNKTFEFIKAKRGSQAQSRLGARVKGLSDAIDRMEKSIKHDRDSVAFQKDRANSTNAGKLEMQLREAKAKMIEARIESKEVKLKDMLDTLAGLKSQLEKANADASKAEPKVKDKKADSKTDKQEPKDGNANSKKEHKGKKSKEKPVVAETPKVEQDAKVAETPSWDEAPKVEEVAKVAEAPKVEEVAKVAEAPKVEEVAKVAEAPKVEEVAKVAEAPKVEEVAKVVEAPKVEEVAEVAEAPKVEEVAKVEEQKNVKIEDNVKPAEETNVSATETVVEESPTSETNLTTESVQQVEKVETEIVEASVSDQIKDEIQDPTSEEE